MMKKVLLFSFFLAAFFSCESDSVSDHNISGLHNRAHYFIRQYFSGYSYKDIQLLEVPESDGKLYEVRLNGNIIIDFDSDGYWLRIYGGGIIPASVLQIFPESVNNYFTVNEIKFSDSVIAIEKRVYGYKMELSNEKCLAFRSGGGFLGYDMGSSLPDKARNLLSDYFPEMTVSYIIEEPLIGDLNVKISEGYTIIFDRYGDWISLSGDTNKHYIPESFLNKIRENFYEYLNINHPGYKVVYISLGLWVDSYYLIIENEQSIRTVHYIVEEDSD